MNIKNIDFLLLNITLVTLIPSWTLGKNEEKFVSAFETWCWRRMLKIKWADRMTNGDVFQRAK